MSKDKGGRSAKKPKADKNKKVSGQTPQQGGGDAVAAAVVRSGSRAR